MNRLPRAVLGAAASAALYFPIHHAIDEPSMEANAANEVQTCASVLGSKAIEASRLMEACGEFRDNFEAVSVVNQNGKMVLQEQLPSSFSLMVEEMPNAVGEDLGTQKANVENDMGAILLGGFAGLGAGLAVYHNDRLKNAEGWSFRRNRQPRRRGNLPSLDATVRSEQ